MRQPSILPSQQICVAQWSQTKCRTYIQNAVQQNSYRAVPMCCENITACIPAVVQPLMLALTQQSCHTSVIRRAFRVIMAIAPVISQHR